MPKLRPLYVLGAGLILSLAVAGCSGDGDSSAVAAAGGPSGGVSGVNLAESAAKVTELKSFRFSGTASLELEGGLPQSNGSSEDDFGLAILSMLVGNLKDVKVEGAYVAPDQMELKINLGGQELGFVQIKDKAWAKFFGSWESVEPGDLGMQGGLSMDNIAVDAIPTDVLNAAKVTKEKVNGMDTTRYSFDKNALQTLAEDFTNGEDLDTANLDLWVNEEGIPVKLSVNMAGKDENGKKISLKGELQLKDLNSSTVTIKAPI